MRRVSFLAVVCVVLAGAAPASALNPALDVSQYAHTAWRVRDGFFKGQIGAIAQTPDGYLWLGTEFGLIRFDGVRFVPWQPPAGQALPSSFVRSLIVGRDGALWIGTLEGVAVWKNGTLTTIPELAAFASTTLIEDRAGTLWVSGILRERGALCAFREGKVACHGEDGRFGHWTGSLYEADDGLWVNADTGLWQWTREAWKLHSLPGTVTSQLQVLTRADGDGVLTVTRGGMAQIVLGNASFYDVPGSPSRIAASMLHRDRDGALWIGTNDRGLLHVRKGRSASFTRADGLSSDMVHRAYEDREGSLWIATTDGLDRFRELAVPRVSVPQGLPNPLVRSVLATPDGSVWLNTGGLTQWNPRQMTGRPIDDASLTTAGTMHQDSRGRFWVSTLGAIGYLENGRFVRVHDIPGDIVNAIAEDARGQMWFLTLRRGLLRLSPTREVQAVPWAAVGRQDNATRLAADPARGGLWMGFLRGGVLHYVDGQIRESYAEKDGLGKGRVFYLSVDRDGTLWVGTAGGLSRVKDGRVATLSAKDGLPCDAVDWLIADDADAYWLLMDCGIARIARAEIDAWTAAVDANRQPRPAIRATLFDEADGVRSATMITSYGPHAAKSVDGRLWFVGLDGASVVDPPRLSVNRLAPPVHIERVSADRQTYDAGSIGAGELGLPALTRDLQIDYTALSLVAPEKMQFRYKLEPWDRDWQAVGTRRQAFYDRLPPGSYRFRVTASNNSGVWNETGATLAFAVAPAYYQTLWFRLSVAGAFAALLVAASRYRARRAARHFAMRLEARVEERMRIARDFHDTTLQSFQGVLLKFQAATNLLPARPDDARKTLETVIEQASQAIREGRDAVQGLRASTLTMTDLAPAIGLLGQQLAADHGGPAPPDLRIEVEGTPRDLAPLVRDEVYRIAGEAMRNAFRHAAATRVEVEVHYDSRQFRLRVRDDGKGIDPAVLAAGGRDGHFGLTGMHERTQLVGGTLAVWSELQSGAEIELTIPASVAYAKAPPVRQ